MEINVDTNEEGYFKYYIFVIFSAIIGFVVLLFLSKRVIYILNEKSIVDVTQSPSMISTIIAAIGVVLFVFFSLVFKEFFRKIFFSEIFMYLYVGALTCAVNLISFQIIINKFALSNNNTSLGWKVAEVVSFVLAVIFAYIANKVFVFKNLDFSLKNVGREVGQFFSARIITEIIGFIAMTIFIDKKGYDSFTVKLIVSIVIIILNYFASKLVVFKKN